MGRWSVAIDEERALEIARDILAAPEPIEGLSPAMCKIIHVLRAVDGRVVQAGDLAEIAAPDPLDPGMKNVATTLISHIRKRRPDLGDKIHTVWGHGYRWAGE